MLDVNDIIEKLKDVLSTERDKKIFDKDVANELNISQANFATMKTRNKVPFSNILDFCALKKISINWLLYGQDPSSLVDSTDKYWIRYLPSTYSSAGGGGESYDEDAKLEIPDYFVSILGGDKNIKNIEAVNVSGDSMEPTITNGSIIFVDRSKTDINRGGVFAFSNEHGVFVKRIQKRIDGKLDIISDNKEYHIQEVFINEIDIKGKIVGTFGSIY